MNKSINNYWRLWILTKNMMDLCRNKVLVQWNVFFTMAVFLFVYGLFSCEAEEDISGGDGEATNPDTGEMVTINFTLNEGGNTIFAPGSGMLSSFPDVTQRNGEGVSRMHTTIPVADNLYMHAVLEEDNDHVRLRATSKLKLGTKVRIVAYKKISGELTKISHADYEVTNSGSLISYETPPMTVPSGEILFVAYSYNDTNPMPVFAEVTAAIPSCYLIRGQTIQTVTPDNTNVRIIMQHLFSRVKLRVEVDPLVGSIIEGISVARFIHSFPELVVQSNELNPGINGLIDFTWSAKAGTASIWNSNYHPVHQSGNSVRVIIEGVKIDHDLYTGPFTVEYAQTLLPATEYTLNVYITRDVPCTEVTDVSITPSDELPFVGTEITLTANILPVDVTGVNYKWEVSSGAGWLPVGTNSATINVTLMNVGDVANRFRVTATNSCTSTPNTATVDIDGWIPDVPQGGNAARITWDWPSEAYPAGRYIITYEPRDAGLYFKYGSIVGIFSDSGGKNKDLSPPASASTASFNASTDLPWKLVSVSNWTGVPYVSTQTVIDHDFHHDTENIKAGMGDPCRLVGADLNYIKNEEWIDQAYIDNMIWRLPTDQENMDFSGRTVSANAFRLHWWDEATQNAINPSPYYGVAGGEMPERAVSPDSPLMFLPAAGQRSLGLIGGQVTSGTYWSSVPYDTGYAYTLSFNAMQLNPLNRSDFKYGFTVRCVYDPVIQP